MKKLYWLASFILLLTLIIQGMPSLAQETADTPLYIGAENGIWAWDGLDLTVASPSDCHGLATASSPTNSCLYVYSIIDQAWLDAEREPFGGGIENPVNIYLGDISTDEEPKLIAGQPENYRIKEDGHAENSIVRGYPVWSPDGTQLAWTETHPEGIGLALVIYDVASATLTTVADDIPEETYTVGGPVSVYWSTHGIVAITATLDDGNNPVPTFILVDLETGEQHSYHFVPPSPMANGFTTSAGSIPEVRRFYTDSGLVILYNDASWQVLYWADGTQAEFTGQLAVVSALAPDGLQVQLAVNETLEYAWTVVPPTGQQEVLPLTVPSTHQMAISPDGSRLAYIDGEDVTVWYDQSTTNVGIDDNPEALWWSPLVWQIVE